MVIFPFPKLWTYLALVEKKTGDLCCSLRRSWTATDAPKATLPKPPKTRSVTFTLDTRVELSECAEDLICNIYIRPNTRVELSWCAEDLICNIYIRTEKNSSKTVAEDSIICNIYIRILRKSGYICQIWPKTAKVALKRGWPTRQLLVKMIKVTK